MLKFPNNNKLINVLQESIAKKASNLGQINLMEVCGSHTMAIAKFGLKNLIPENVALLSGPGCPVCVTPNETIDKMVALSKIPNIIITTFGDMMKVPGSTSSLSKEKAQGANIEVVYSPLDAFNLAKENPNLEVVFLGVGFETTAPTTAATIKRSQNLKLKNFSVFCAHKNMPGALDLIASDKNVKINGLILPGHVSTITGLSPYKFLSDKYKIPGVVSGFEAVDILHAIDMLLCQLENKVAKIENAYTRGVRDEGNTTALDLINEVFETCNSNWRGLGCIENSGYVIRDEYKNYNAEYKYHIEAEVTHENKACKCGDVLCGIINPDECPLFKKTCNPKNPIGPCMVSSEGSCAAAFKY